MLKTEEEARQMPCHQDFARGGVAGADCCLASNCPAWRWGVHKEITVPEGNECQKDGWEKAYTLVKGKSVFDVYRCPDNEREGYCGLAGKPERA